MLKTRKGITSWQKKKKSKLRLLLQKKCVGHGCCLLSTKNIRMTKWYLQVYSSVRVVCDRTDSGNHEQHAQTDRDKEHDHMPGSIQENFLRLFI